MQLNGEGGGQKAYNGIVDCFVKIIKTEGVGGIHIL